MPAQTYTTDLLDLNLVNVVGGTTNWTALGGGAAGLVAETDFYIQGDGCLSKGGWSAATRGMIYNFGSGITVATGSAVFMWLYFWAPNALDTQANGGMQIIAGNSAAAFKQWYVLGSDTLTYGGWKCIPVDVTKPASATTGAPTATVQYFGAQAKILGAVTKGQPLGIDTFRYGTTLKVLNGETTASANFLSASVINDSGSNRWGLFQRVDGGYLQQGTFLMGSGSTLVRFSDTGRNIIIADTQIVQSTFNKFEIQNVSSSVTWDSIAVSSLGTTSPGNFVVTDNATVALSACSMKDMGYFVLQSNTTVENTIFENCNLITQSSAVFDGCTFRSSKASTQIISNNPELITNCSFYRVNGVHHAIELTTSGSFTFTGNTFSNFGDTNTTSASLYNNSGGPVTMSISTGDTPTYRNGAGATTSIVNNISVTLTGMIDGTEVRVYSTGTINELAGVEEATVGSSNDRSFTFSLTAGLIVDIVIINVTYNNQRIDGYTIPAENSSIPIQQSFDRNYSNP